MLVRIGSLATVVMLVAAPALGQSTGPAIEALLDEAVFVEAGAEEVDRSKLQEAIDTAEGFGVDLKIAVLAESSNPQGAASDIVAGLGSVTVLVFTPDAYGVFSNEISQGRLDDALSTAEDALSGPDAGAGASALAAALDPDRDNGGFSTGLVVAGVVALLVVVGVAGRLWEVKTRETRQARRRNRRRSELTERTRQIGDRVLELSDPVELAEDPGLASSFAAASTTFDQAETAIATASTMHQLDDVEHRLDEADSLLDQVSHAVESSRP